MRVDVNLEPQDMHWVRWREDPPQRVTRPGEQITDELKLHGLKPVGVRVPLPVRAALHAA